MTGQYDITTTTHPAPAPTGRPRLSLRTAGVLCAIGGLIAAAGSIWLTTVDPQVPDTQMSSPLTPGAFRATELIWALTHLLTLFGALGLAATALAGTSRASRVGHRITIAGMAVLVPAELAFIAAATAREDSGLSIAMSAIIGLGAVLASAGFTVTGVTTLRAGRWHGWGRFTPLLCGLFGLLVLTPLVPVPGLFNWVIAGWNVCLALLGVALIRAETDQKNS